MACTDKPENPFFTDWETPFAVPPFDLIEIEHYLPALQHGLQLELQEIDAIVGNPDAPTFANTIEAFEAGGQFLDRVENVFGNLSSTDANDEMDQIDMEYSQLKARHNDDIRLCFPGQIYCLLTIGGFAYKFHVRLRGQHHAQSLPNNGVIISN